jgi:hypothetical protein
MVIKYTCCVLKYLTNLDTLLSIHHLSQDGNGDFYHETPCWSVMVLPLNLERSQACMVFVTHLYKPQTISYEEEMKYAWFVYQYLTIFETLLLANHFCQGGCRKLLTQNISLLKHDFTLNM